VTVTASGPGRAGPPPAAGVEYFVVTNVTMPIMILSSLAICFSSSILDLNDITNLNGELSDQKTWAKDFRPIFRCGQENGKNGVPGDEILPVPRRRWRALLGGPGRRFFLLELEGKLGNQKILFSINNSFMLKLLIVGGRAAT
jgi:hypothetical protein